MAGLVGYEPLLVSQRITKIFNPARPMVTLINRIEIG
jgi:hypothetical protein